MDFVIKERRLKDALVLAKQIPEFEDPYPDEEYRRRLTGKRHLILVAYINEKPVGFKIGYERDTDGSFYSWMGGVLPEFRRQHVSQKLAVHQERWAREKGYRSIRLKTRNKYRAMLHLALERGFYLTGVIAKDPPRETRILMEKPLF